MTATNDSYNTHSSSKEDSLLMDVEMTDILNSETSLGIARDKLAAIMRNDINNQSDVCTLTSTNCSMDLILCNQNSRTMLLDALSNTENDKVLEDLLKQLSDGTNSVFSLNILHKFEFEEVLVDLLSRNIGDIAKHIMMLLSNMMNNITNSWLSIKQASRIGILSRFVLTSRDPGQLKASITCLGILLRNDPDNKEQVINRDVIDTLVTLLCEDPDFSGSDVVDCMESILACPRNFARLNKNKFVDGLAEFRGSAKNEKSYIGTIMILLEGLTDPPRWMMEYICGKISNDDILCESCLPGLQKLASNVKKHGDSIDTEFVCLHLNKLLKRHHNPCVIKNLLKIATHVLGEWKGQELMIDLLKDTEVFFTFVYLIDSTDWEVVKDSLYSASKLFGDGSGFAQESRDQFRSAIEQMLKKVRLCEHPDMRSNLMILGKEALMKCFKSEFEGLRRFAEMIC